MAVLIGNNNTHSLYSTSIRRPYFPYDRVQQGILEEGVRYLILLDIVSRLISHFEGHLSIDAVLHNLVFFHVRLKIPNID